MNDGPKDLGPALDAVMAIASTSSPLIQGQNCKQCAGPLTLKVMDSGVHYAKLICVACGTFNGWQSKPDADKYQRPAGHRGLARKYGNGFCQLCLLKEDQLQKGDALIGHHVEEYACGGSAKKENVWVLCTSCHELIHWMRRLRRRSCE